MFKGYNLNIILQNVKDFEYYFNEGKKQYHDCGKQVGKTFKSFLEKDGTIDGTKLQENWFPMYNYDVFISHSHDDEDLAIYLSGWLLKKHGITSFIDSCLWGYSNTLLNEIDSEYSWLDENKSIYSYNKVIYSSSHIHMMLSNALAMMIDKSECFVFLNTPKSIVPFKEMDKTKSPWIYSEIVLSKIIEKKPPNRDLFIIESFKYFSEKKKLKINYNLDLSHLKTLNYSQFFEEWGRSKYPSRGMALNILYNKF